MLIVYGRGLLNALLASVLNTDLSISGLLFSPLANAEGQASAQVAFQVQFVTIHGCYLSMIWASGLVSCRH
jgi:hypothetical protein